MLIYNDETYTVRKKTPGRCIRWGCAKAKSKGCKGGVTTDDPMGNARNLTEHNHISSHVDVEIAMFRSELRTTAQANTKAPTKVLLQTCMQNLSPEALSKMKSMETISRAIQRTKSRMKPPELPPTMLDSSDASLPRLNLPNHVAIKVDQTSNAGYGEWACGYCSKQLPSTQQASHVNVCEFVPVPCPQGCGEVGIRRNVLDQHLKVCSRVLLRCDFHCYGCLFIGAEEDRKKHEAESCPAHLSLAKQHIKSLEKRLEEQSINFKNMLDAQNNNFNTRLELLESRSRIGTIEESGEGYIEQTEQEGHIIEQTEREGDLLTDISFANES